MAVLVKLGDIELNAKEVQIDAPFERKRSHRFAEHSRIEGKPRLQKVGGKLDILSLELFLSPSLVNVSEMLPRLRALMDGDPRELYVADRYKGKWVIESMSETVANFLQNDGEWKETHVKVKLELKEFVATNTTTGLGRAILGGFPVFG